MVTAVLRGCSGCERARGVDARRSWYSYDCIFIEIALSIDY